MNQKYVGTALSIRFCCRLLLLLHISMVRGVGADRIPPELFVCAEPQHNAEKNIAKQIRANVGLTSLSSFISSSIRPEQADVL
jgi:hypothetical protein